MRVLIQTSLVKTEVFPLVDVPDYDWGKAPVICELYGLRWLLGPEAEQEMDWKAAIEWCQTVGGELLPRNILLEAYMNNEIRKEFTATYYWSSTEFTATYAWSQGFTYGHQYSSNKTTAYYVRAARRLVI